MRWCWFQISHAGYSSLWEHLFSAKPFHCRNDDSLGLERLATGLVNGVHRSIFHATEFATELLDLLGCCRSDFVVRFRYREKGYTADEGNERKSMLNKANAYQHG